MSKLICIVLAFGLSYASAYSQNESLENARWVNARTVYTGGFNRAQLAEVYEITTTTADTSINGKSYLKLFGKPYAPNIYIGAIRADSTRWYFCAADSLAEMLLYDFGLQVGDTLTERMYVDECTYVDSLICTNVSNWAQNGKVYGLIEFQAGGGNNGSSQYLLPGKWLIGIGNWQGMLKEFYPNISGYGLDLACFGINDTVRYSGGPYLYSNTQTVGCDVTFSEAEREAEEELIVYPNPAKDHLWIEWGAFSGSYTVKIVSLKGRVLNTELINEPKSKISLNLPPGLYLLRYGDDQNLNLGTEIFSVRH
jgi:hypothetical protein